MYLEVYLIRTHSRYSSKVVPSTSLSFSCPSSSTPRYIFLSLLLNTRISVGVAANTEETENDENLSEPKKVDKAESDKNGVRRKKLYYRPI